MPKYQSTTGLLTFYKNRMPGTSGLKASWLIRIQDCLNYNISQTSWGKKLNFCIRLNIHGSNKFTKTFQVGVARHPCACSKLCRFCVSFISRMSGTKKLVFSSWLGIHKSYKFVQSFQVGIFKHVQSGWKQWVSYNSKMILVMNLIFCM